LFLSTVPVGGAAAALAPRTLPPGDGIQRAGRGALDLPGGLTVVAGLVVLVYALSGAPDHGWGSARTLGLLAVAATLLVAFLVIERSTEQPLLPPSLWRIGSLRAGAAMMLGLTGILAGAFFLNSLYLQRVLGWSALETGLGFLPLVVAIAFGVHLTSHLVARVGGRALVAGGLALTATGALLLALAPDDARYAGDLLPGFLVFGLGVGLAFPAVSITALGRIDEARAGLASGLLSTAHEVGAALGVAVLSAIAAAGGTVASAAGYGDACLAAAIAAGALAVLAVATVPAIRPAPGAAVSIH
jgi:Na+/melibiose symporter-like transporter